MEVVLLALIALPLLGLMLVNAGVDLFGSDDERALPYYECEKHKRLTSAHGQHEVRADRS